MVVGSIPTVGVIYTYILCVNKLYALVAQWIAHWTSNPEVAGSNPVKSVTYFIVCKFIIYITCTIGAVGSA